MVSIDQHTPAPVAGLPSLDYIRGRVSVIANHGAGHCDCGTELAQWLEPLLAEVERLRDVPNCTPDVRLSPAEDRVARLLRNTDLSAQEIADRLHVGLNTVKTQAKAVYRKLHVGSRLELRALDTEPAK